MMAPVQRMCVAHIVLGLYKFEESSTKKKHKTPPMRFEPVDTMNNTAWLRARLEAELGDLHVHDLRHTVGMRLRAAQVPERTIGDILWHTGCTVTAHYSDAEHREFFNALERIKNQGAEHSPSLLSLHSQSRAKRASKRKQQKA